MISINPQPESSPPIVKPRKDETLHSWLTRKKFTLLFYNTVLEAKLKEG